MRESWVGHIHPVPKAIANAPIDFQDVSNWEANKLDRTQSSRMGWTDVSLCLCGPAVQDLRTHFSQRWNFIYGEKYSKKATRYAPLSATLSGAQQAPEQRGFNGEEGGGERGFDSGEYDGQGERGLFGRSDGGGFRNQILSRVNENVLHAGAHYGHHGSESQQYQSHAEHGGQRGMVECQIARSSAKWSHNISTEHSIQNAYIETIRNSKHFVYIENQFFITATGDQQKPVKNQVGAAIVERIIRAARNGERYKMMVMMPSVPAFAGDLQSDDALGTRAIMEFQYNSINRGGHSIYEQIAQAGINPMDYIRFYNLRSYDRINASGAMRVAEQNSGVSYQQASEGYDAAHDRRRGDGEFEGTRGDFQAYRPPPTAGYGVYEMDASSGVQGGYGQQQYGQNQPYNAEYGGRSDEHKREDYNRYQQAAANIGSRQGLGDGRWDSVSECYMLGGQDIRNVPWEGGAMDEIDAFVSEELYIHSKVSANMMLQDYI
jgi:phospholipase D1/2